MSKLNNYKCNCNKCEYIRQNYNYSITSTPESSITTKSSIKSSIKTSLKSITSSNINDSTSISARKSDTNDSFTYEKYNKFINKNKHVKKNSKKHSKKDSNHKKHHKKHHKNNYGDHLLYSKTLSTNSNTCSNSSSCFSNSNRCVKPCNTINISYREETIKCNRDNDCSNYGCNNVGNNVGYVNNTFPCKVQSCNKYIDVYGNRLVCVTNCT